MKSGTHCLPVSLGADAGPDGGDLCSISDGVWSANRYADIIEVFSASDGRCW